MLGGRLSREIQSAHRARSRSGSKAVVSSPSLLEHPPPPNGNHHRVAPKKVSKIERSRPTTSVQGYVLAVFRARARAQRSGARARSIKRAIVSFHPGQRAARAGIC